jgi:PPIC-type PPIASE domain
MPMTTKYTLTCLSAILLSLTAFQCHAKDSNITPSTTQQAPSNTENIVQNIKHNLLITENEDIFLDGELLVIPDTVYHIFGSPRTEEDGLTVLKRYAAILLYTRNSPITKTPEFLQQQYLTHRSIAFRGLIQLRSKALAEEYRDEIAVMKQKLLKNAKQHEFSFIETQDQTIANNLIKQFKQLKQKKPKTTLDTLINQQKNSANNNTNNSATKSWQFLPSTDLPQAVINQLNTMKPGQLSSVPIQVNSNYYIVQLHQVRKATQTSLSDEIDGIIEKHLAERVLNEFKLSKFFTQKVELPNYVSINPQKINDMLDLSHWEISKISTLGAPLDTLERIYHFAKSQGVMDWKAYQNSIAMEDGRQAFRKGILALYDEQERQITPEQAKKLLKETGPKTYTTRYLTFKSEAHAKNILKQLQAGQSIDAVVNYAQKNNYQVADETFHTKDSTVFYSSESDVTQYKVGDIISKAKSTAEGFVVSQLISITPTYTTLEDMPRDELEKLYAPVINEQVSKKLSEFIQTISVEQKTKNEPPENNEKENNSSLSNEVQPTRPPED